MKRIHSLLKDKVKGALLFVMVVVIFRGASAFAQAISCTPPGMVLIPAGTFEMGDHQGFVEQIINRVASMIGTS